ncbi:hypothetical protein BGAL_0240g00150 [Botrytis galanthina]|uniref:Uncharacterized protein n=1 Tax=Botrytis galanthina TaxID=278940 RepID=A0A4V4HU94_9HELO|nr:hypothetical protein BGAL_0240g00150 [Botrytis galanthina]
MPPKKVVKVPAKGKNAYTHLAAAAATNSSTTTTTTITAATTIVAAAATVVASCEPRNISNRTLECEARGIPWFIGTMRENLNQALCRTVKTVKSSKRWQTANPTDKKAMIQVARSQKEQQERDRGFDWREAARNMGFRAKGDNFLWKEGCPIYGTAGASDPTKEAEEEEELPFSLPDDEPTIKKRRRDDDDDDDDPNGDYTKRAFRLPSSSPVLCGLRTAAAASVLSFLLLVFSAVVLFVSPLPSATLSRNQANALKIRLFTKLPEGAISGLVWSNPRVAGSINLFLRSYIIFTRAKTS